MTRQQKIREALARARRIREANVGYALRCVRDLHPEIDEQRAQDIRAILNWSDQRDAQDTPGGCATQACIIYGWLRCNEARRIQAARLGGH